MKLPPPPPLLLCLVISAASAADIPLGSTLYASDPNSRWSSTNNTFALSFIADSSGTLIAAVTYNNVPIWQAGPSVKSSAVLRLLSSGDLQILPSDTSTSPLWSSATANLRVTAAEVKDSGDLVLKNSTGAAVWSSFDHPIDTVVPNQQLNTKHALKSGLYSFRILQNGNLVLSWNNSIIYYISGVNSTANPNFTNPILEIESTGILTLSDPALPVDLSVAYATDYGENSSIFRIMRLDNDGNLRIYSFIQGSNTLTPGWAAVRDQCQVYGFCGNLGICSYNDTSPICGCASQNFELVDSRDPRKGCKRKVKLQDCPNLAHMEQLDHSMLLTFQPELESQVFYMGNSACKYNCLAGTACIASTSLSDGSGTCYLKRTGSFMSGFRSPSIPSTSFIKVCSVAMPNPTAGDEGRKNRWRLKAWMVVVAVLAALLAIAAVEGCLWWSRSVFSLRPS